ncbi:MAG: putative Ig domain-containing protein [Fimbriimonadaceae bacterium]|nr:putative Ig domain-containing protein [Fimbriimonadaceae bacterium]
MTTGRAFALGLLLTVATTGSFLMQGRRAPIPAADPVLDPIGNKSVDELAPLNFTVTASDPDLGDTLTFTLDATSLGKGMTINPMTGDFSWTPTETQDGPHTVTVTVTDSTLATDDETITIDVNELNVAPTLGLIAGQACFEANAQGSNPQNVNFFAAGADTDFVLGVPNGLTYTLDATSLGKGMTINPTTGEFLWAPTELQDGVHSVTVTVHDNQVPDLTASRTFSITVTEVNEPPVITVAADGFVGTVFHGQGIWRDVTLSDPDVVLGVPNTVTASLNANPDANYNPATGHWVIAPKAPAAGPFVSTLTATDSGVPPFSVPMSFPYTAMAPPGHDYAVGGHAGEIRQVDADGMVVMTASADGTAKIWGDLGPYFLKKTLAGHNGPLTGIVNRFGTVVTSSEDGYLIEWDRTTGAMLAVSPAHAGPVNCMSKNVVMDGWVTGGEDWKVKVWTGLPGPALTLMGHTNAITDVAGWGPWTVSGSRDKTVRVWFGTMLSWPVITDHTGEITAVDLFADGGPDRWVATAAKDRKFNLYKNAVQVFSLDLGEVVTEIRFELALDGRIFVGTETGKLIVLDRTGAILFTYNDAKGPIRSIKHFGSFVYVTGADRAVRWYSMFPGPGLTLIRELSAHGDWITNVASLPFGGAFSPYVTGSWDGKAIFWDGPAMSRIATFDHGSPLVAGLASPYSTIGRDGSIKFWSFGIPDWTVGASAMNPEAPWSAATFLGANVMVGAQNGNVRFWDSSGLNVFTFNSGSPVTSMDGTRAGAPVTRIATGGSDGVVKVYNPITTVEWTFSGHMGPAMGVSFSRNGRRLAVAAGMIYVYDLNTGAKLMAVMERTGIGSCAMNPTGETVAVIQHPNIVRVYRVFDGAVVYTSPSEPGLYATSINWNDTGDRLTVTRQDGSFYRVDMGGSGPIPPTSSFSAPVAFRDTEGKPNSVNVRVYRKGTTDLVKEETALISNDGRIRVELDERGQYDVVAKSATFLARKVAMDLRTQNVGQLVFDLRNGDVNGDNTVNIADFLLVRKAFGASQGGPGYLAGADLNKDGRVDIRDFVIVRRNFGVAGDR